MLSTFLPAISTCPRPLDVLLPRFRLPPVQIERPSRTTATRTTYSLQDRRHRKHPGVVHSTRTTTNSMPERSTTHEPATIRTTQIDEKTLEPRGCRNLSTTPTNQRRADIQKHFTKPFGHLLSRRSLKMAISRTNDRATCNDDGEPGAAITSNHKPTAIQAIAHIRTRACKHLHEMEEGGRAYGASSRFNLEAQYRRTEVLEVAIGSSAHGKSSLQTALGVWCDFLVKESLRSACKVNGSPRCRARKQNDYTKRIPDRTTRDAATRTLSRKRRPSPTRSHSSNPATPPQRYREPADDDDDDVPNTHPSRRHACPTAAVLDSCSMENLPDHRQQRTKHTRTTSGTYRVPDLQPSSRLRPCGLTITNDDKHSVGRKSGRQ
ncbi:hypothetical protein DFP72DRAFT_888905 [Ephemerocybe angulata]|uniref:Uncharacterized protein n=1 Tax=Ephemerocybe angulata TaxID=980116 RepID=A0A8H6M755_9AGAR|nr:hypothetical protein DFP72DRAFT_888905 [Tulosesus angulatus]